MAKIKAFIMDVDGTLTDGKIYMGSKGEVFKAFNIKDGYGVHEILPENGIKTVIMTGRNSEIVLNRARELEIDVVLQNIKDKKRAIDELKEMLHCESDEMVYIGDDIIDIAAMKECGFAVCPGDAVKEVKEICQYICKKNGGQGAVREVIEWLRERNFTVGEIIDES